MLKTAARQLLAEAGGITLPERKTKLDVFTSSIMSASRQEVQQINDSLEKSWNKAVYEAKTSLKAEVEKYKTETRSAISAREHLRVNDRMTANKHEMLQFRENCAREVFQMVREHIQGFTRSEEYPRHLCDLVNRACEILGVGATGDAYLRPEDMHLCELLQEATPDIDLVFHEGSFVYGGIQINCQPKHMRIDMSFDAALSDLVGHFSELSSMYLED